MTKCSHSHRYGIGQESSLSKLQVKGNTVQLQLVSEPVAWLHDMPDDSAATLISLPQAEALHADRLALRTAEFTAHCTAQCCSRCIS